MAKRYGEIMKTMWFTFFYASAIPLGILWSCIGLTIYYFVDKVNYKKKKIIKYLQEKIINSITYTLEDIYKKV